MNNVLIYSRKAYTQDRDFAFEVESTAKVADSLEHHIEMLENAYPDYTIRQLWTYSHSGMVIETTPSCRWDSSADAFAAYKDEDEFLACLAEINEEL